MPSMLAVPETISSSQARPRAIDLISAVRRSAFIGRARDLALEAGSRISFEPLGRRLRPGDQQRGVFFEGPPGKFAAGQLPDRGRDEMKADRSFQYAAASY